MGVARPHDRLFEVGIEEVGRLAQRQRVERHDLAAQIGAGILVADHRRAEIRQLGRPFVGAGEADAVTDIGVIVGAVEAQHQRLVQILLGVLVDLRGDVDG